MPECYCPYQGNETASFWAMLNLRRGTGRDLAYAGIGVSVRQPLERSLGEPHSRDGEAGGSSDCCPRRYESNKRSRGDSGGGKTVKMVVLFWLPRSPSHSAK